MKRNLDGSVIVITGASSGIGYATALELARNYRCNLALASRSREPLESVASELQTLGAETLVVPTDVSDAAEVGNLATRTVERFGRIDFWINAAAVAEWSTIDASDPAEIEQIIDVDLLGVIWGAKAALCQMRQQAQGGVIVNIGSGLGDRAVPLLSIYSVAKHGVTGFSDALRMEIDQEKLPIDVMLVQPSSINTPFYSHGKSKLGVRPHPISRIYEPEVAARSIVRAMARPSRDLYIGAAARGLALLQRLSPTVADHVLARAVRVVPQQFTSRPDGGESNLFESDGASNVHGEFGDEAKKSSVYSHVASAKTTTKAAMILGAIALGIAGVAAAKRK